jgi:hypothetical protein
MAEFNLKKVHDVNPLRIKIVILFKDPFRTAQ